MIVIRPQSEFPHLEAFKARFAVTNDTIFAWDKVIYTNNQLPNHLIVHERTHHEQQTRYGLEEWLRQYLHDDKFRLRMELEAYIHQLVVVSDRNHKLRLRQECARNLSSELYGNIISYEDAFNKLK